MKRCLSLALAAVVLSCTTLPRRGQIAMRDISFPLKDRVLPSGLRIVVEEDHTEPLVAVITLIGAGGADDPKGKEGLAHFVEHLAFRSKPDANGPNVWNRLEQAGVGTINAFTSLDYTLYYAVGPKESLPQLLQLHGTLTIAPVLSVTPEVFEVERQVVRSELRQRNETGWVSQGFAWTQEAVFPPGHPYHRPVVGTHESLTAIKPDDVGSFARSHYRPDNATMVIIGDVDMKAIDPVLESALPQRLFRGAGVVPQRLGNPTEPALREAQPFVQRHASVVTPEIYIGWSLPRSFDAESHVMQYAVTEANAVLGGAFMADTDIRGASLSLIPGKQGSLVLCRVVLTSGRDPKRSAEAVLDQLYKAWGSTSDTLDRSANTQVANVEFAHRRLRSVIGMLEDAQSLTGRAIFRAETTHFFKDPGAFSRALGSMARIDASKVQDFSFKYLNRDRARIVYMAPHPAGTEPPASATGLGTEASDLVPVTASQAPEALKNRPAPQRFAQAKTVTLSNGVEVVVLPRPGLPLATVSVLLHGGLAQAEPLGAGAWAHWLGHPGSRLNGSPHEFGGSERSLFDEDEIRYEYSASSGNVANLIAIASERVPSMKVDEGALTYFKREYMESQRLLDAKPEVAAERNYSQAIFGKHPYGRASTAEDMERAGLMDIFGYFGRTHVPKNAVVAIVGDFDPETVVPLAATWFGGWRGDAEETAVPPAPSHAAGPVKTLVTHKPAATQAVLRVGCLLPSTDAAARVRHQLVAEVVGSELNRAIREEQGASYGIYGDAAFFRGGLSKLEFGGAVDRTRFGKVIETLQATLRKHSEEGPSPVALERARWRLQRAFDVSFSSNTAAANAIVRARNLGSELSSLDAFPKDLAAVRSDQLQKDVKACLDALVISAMGDEPSIAPALAGGATP